MAAATNTTSTTDIAKVQSIDIANQFNGSITKLIEALGVTRKVALKAGMTFKTYKKTKTMATTTAGEGEVIPLSKVALSADKTVTMTFDKFRKAVTVEAIQKSGFETAVIDTDTTLQREVQKSIRTKLFNYIKTGTGTGTAETLQGALATSWGKVQTEFEDDGVNTIVFVNPMDVADYIGKANITTQSVFGLTIISGFTGVTVITNTNIPVGEVYATAPENLVFVYIPIEESELKDAFNFTMDETGYIGVTHTSVSNNLSYETVMVSGISIYAERLDGVFKISIEEPEDDTVQGS